MSFRFVERKPEALFSLQAISVPTPGATSTSHTSHSGLAGSSEQTDNNVAAASPSSRTLAHDPDTSYPPIPSPPLSLYQENEQLQVEEQRESISPEPSNEHASNQIQSPLLQFELNESFLHPPRPNHAHPPASSAYPIQLKPVSMFPLLSPIFSEGSPILAEGKDWTMSPSHSHADLHKVGSQRRMERELSPLGLGLHVSGEEERGAIGGEGIVFELNKLPSNGVDSVHQEGHEEFGEKEELSLETGVMESARGGEGEQTEGLEVAKIEEQRTKCLEATQSERMHPFENEQGLPHSADQHKDSTAVNHFQEELAPPTAVVGYCPSPSNSSGLVRTGLATPHMIRSVWDAEADQNSQQVIYRTSIQEDCQSPQRNSHFLEDFID